MAYTSSKTGYIQSYKVELNPQPLVHHDYLFVTITDDTSGALNLETWVLIRNIAGSVDNFPSGDNCAVTYANVSQALIATIKDAFQNQNKVLLEGYPHREGAIHQPVAGKFTLNAVTILK
jgi:hypothetical protein